jgi:hypothetical protein
MDLTIKTKISELLKEYPFLIDFLPTISTAYKKLKNPILYKVYNVYKDIYT